VKAELWIAFWWAVFAVTHMMPSSVWLRERLVARLGAKGFLGLYSLAALATFVPLVRSYLGSRHAGEMIWNLAGVPGARYLAMALSVLGIALVVGAELQPSPAQVGATGARGSGGLTRITRHPLFMGMSMWALGHLVINGYATDVLFFGGMLAFSLVGAAHQDARKRASEAERLGRFLAETSFWPFAAIIAGRNRIVWSELPWAGLAAGAVVAGVVEVVPV